jgi:LacI family transcriptional regulator
VALTLDERSFFGFFIELTLGIVSATTAQPSSPTTSACRARNTVQRTVPVLAAAQSLGITVPHDLSVVGYNDIPLSARLPVPLTTVRVPLSLIADAAVELLNRRPDDTSSSIHRVAAPTLIPRGSTTRPRMP